MITSTLKWSAIFNSFTHDCALTDVLAAVMLGGTTNIFSDIIFGVADTLSGVMLGVGAENINGFPVVMSRFEFMPASLEERMPCC